MKCPHIGAPAASPHCNDCTDQGILSGTAIEAAVKRGDIEIDPFDPKQLNPASYDVRLGEEVCVYNHVVYVEGPPGGETLLALPPTEMDAWLDARRENPVHRFRLSQSGFLLKPGIGYLLHTRERVKTHRYVPIVDGKSSIGRLFIQIHATAGYGDPGFDGQYTLEVIVVHPVIVYPGMRFGQIRFHTMVGEPVLYAGNYIGETSRGPVPSKSYKQFKEPSR